MTETMWFKRAWSLVLKSSKINEQMVAYPGNLIFLMCMELRPWQTYFSLLRRRDSQYIRHQLVLSKLLFYRHYSNLVSVHKRY